MWNLILKRFKQFSLIDYLIVLIIISVGIFFTSNFIKKTVYVYVDLTNMQNFYGQDLPTEYWQTSDIETGDKAYNSFGKVIAEITDIRKQIWSSGARSSVDMTVKVKTAYDAKQKQFLLDGSPILVGERIKFNFGSKEYDGLIRNVYQNKENKMLGYRKAKAKVVVRLRSYELEHLNKLKDFKLSDSTGSLILRVKEIEITPAAVYIASTIGQKIFEGSSKNLSDAILTIDIPEVWCKNDICYYNYYQTFSIGSNFWADNGDVWFGTNTTIIDRKIIYE